MTSLRTQAIADLEFIFLVDEFAVAITINGNAAIAIPLDKFGEVEDPRAPKLRVKESDLVGITHGMPAVFNGTSYIIEGYQPDGEGLATVQLRDAAL